MNLWMHSYSRDFSHEVPKRCISSLKHSTTVRRIPNRGHCHWARNSSSQIHDEKEGRKSNVQWKSKVFPAKCKVSNKDESYNNTALQHFLLQELKEFMYKVQCLNKSNILISLLEVFGQGGVNDLRGDSEFPKGSVWRWGRISFSGIMNNWKCLVWGLGRLQQVYQTGQNYTQ